MVFVSECMHELFVGENATFFFQVTNVWKAFSFFTFSEMIKMIVLCIYVQERKNSRKASAQKPSGSRKIN